MGRGPWLGKELYNFIIKMKFKHYIVTRFFQKFSFTGEDKAPHLELYESPASSDAGWNGFNRNVDPKEWLESRVDLFNRFHIKSKPNKSKLRKHFFGFGGVYGLGFLFFSFR